MRQRGSVHGNPAAVLNTYPDREGIETWCSEHSRRPNRLNTYPDREGIETSKIL